MIGDFIDLHPQLIALVEGGSVLAVIAFLLGDMVGYARAQRDRKRSIKMIEEVVDSARRGGPFNANHH